MNNDELWQLHYELEYQLAELQKQNKRLQELVKMLEQFEPASHWNERNRIS